MAMTEREQIEDLTAIYARALDRKDYAGIADCFAADAEVEYGGYSQRLEGRDAIVAHMKLALDPLDATQHLFANFIIAVEGNEASLACDILAQHVRGGETFLAGGRYEVLLKQVSERWVFARLSARTAWSDGNRAILPKA